MVKSRWQSGLQATQNRHASMTMFQNDGLGIVVPWEAGDVQKLLEEHNTKPEDFGMSLEGLAADVATGHLYFSTRNSDGKLVCVRDEILVRIISPMGQAVLVELGGGDSGGTET